MSDYQDIDEWATAIDTHRGGTTTCDTGDGLAVIYRHFIDSDGVARSSVGIGPSPDPYPWSYEWAPLDEDFTREDLLREARRLIAETLLIREQDSKAAATRRMLISRRLVQSARTSVQSSGWDTMLDAIIRAGQRAGLTRDQMVDLLESAYRGSGNRLHRPEGWETTLATGQVDRALAEEPRDLEDVRVDEELRHADAIVSSEEGRALMRAVDEAMRQEQATAAAIARRDDAIRAALEAGMSQRQVARVTGISQQRITQIKRGTRK